MEAVGLCIPLLPRSLDPILTAPLSYSSARGRSHAPSRAPPMGLTSAKFGSSRRT